MDKEKSELIEKKIKYAISIAKEYEGQGPDTDDIIGEAELALTKAVIDFSGEGDINSCIENAVRAAVTEMIKEHNESKAEDEDIANRVNELSDVSVEMVQELGRQPTNEELAKRLNTSTEAVDALIRMSMDALSGEMDKYQDAVVPTMEDIKLAESMEENE